MFRPEVLLVASDECRQLLPTFENELVRITKYEDLRTKHDPDINKVAADLKLNQSNLDNFTQSVINETTDPRNARHFECLSHFSACIFVVSSKSTKSSISKLNEQSFDLPFKFMSTQFVRCLWFLETDESNLNFDELELEYKHCFKLDLQNIHGVIEQTFKRTLLPYLQQVKNLWENANQQKSIGRFFKRLILSGPPKPEFDVFREVALKLSLPNLPFPEFELDIDMQMRRLADLAFLLKDFKLALSAYESLRKPFLQSQRFAELGGVCEMVAVVSLMLQNADVNTPLDTALYTYTAQVNLPLHFLRCALLVSNGFNLQGEQLRAADLLMDAIMELNPTILGGDEPALSGVLMEHLARCYALKGFKRKEKLWERLAELEFKNVHYD